MSDHEARRLVALQRYGLLDSPPEAIFDGITVAIANICEVPIALVSLVGDDRQWFKSAYGVQVKQTPRDVAFCAHAIERPDSMMVIEDAASDEQFRSNPLVVRDPGIRFYAGKPIVTEDGYALGTLCVIDRKPRKLLKYQLEALSALGKTVSAILDERIRLQKIAIDRDGVEELLREREFKFRHLYEDAESILRGVLHQLPSAAVVVDGNGEIVTFNDSWQQFATDIGWSQSLSGGNILNACSNDSSPFMEKADEISSGIRDVISGKDRQFKIEFRTTNGECTIDVAKLLPDVPGAIVQHYYSA